MTDDPSRAPYEPANVRKLIVKVGTTTLMDSCGRLDREFVADLAGQLATQRNQGREVVLVSSGAIGVGREHLASRELVKDSATQDNAQPAPRTAKRPISLPFKQAAAAVGQGILMHSYTVAFASHNQAVAQVLLTRDDLADRKRFLNARNTLSALLALGVIPIINENDTVAVEEINFGDNDTLAARVAVLVGADLLLILSDVEGLYEMDNLPQAIPQVTRIDKRIESLSGDSTSGSGTGGMKTKLEAAKIATASGIRTVIALGRRPGVIGEVAGGKQVGTTFLPGSGRVQGRKRWLAAGSRSHGVITVNEGAGERIENKGVSLLAVGIVDVSGEFGAGELIDIHDTFGRRIAKGVANYGASDVRLLQGLKSSQIEEAIGYKTHDEIVHRDNMVVESS